MQAVSHFRVTYSNLFVCNESFDVKLSWSARRLTSETVGMQLASRPEGRYKTRSYKVTTTTASSRKMT